MDVLVDSNLLVRLANSTDPQCTIATDAADKLRQDGHTLHLVPQNIYEFWSVATRPSNLNGLGFTVAQVQVRVAGFKQFFSVRNDDPAIFAQWEQLVGLHAIVGKNVHDARLVAAMIVHGITHLLTFNKQDFQRYTNITSLTPAEVMALP
jgi:predicted nucleic acid-binding protein